MTRTFSFIVTVLSITMPASVVVARDASVESRNQSSLIASNNAYCNTQHDVGRIALGVSNDGTIGIGLSVTGTNTDCFTGQQLATCEFPKYSGSLYLFGGALWIGAVVGQDTLVSTGADGWSVSGNEFHPEAIGIGEMIYRSSIDPSRPEYIGAVSQEDYLGVYYDTCHNCNGVSDDEVDNRSHRPLGIRITQTSYAWSHAYAEDFVILEYLLENISDQTLNDLYFGYYVDADIHSVADIGGQGAQDDMTGFLLERNNPLIPDGCVYSHRLGLAWAADNDGDMDDPLPVTAVTGVRPLFDISSGVNPSYNWYISNSTASLDYGPQRRAHSRDFGTGGTGTPPGDRNKYFILSNHDIDFDLAYVATIGSTDSIWLPPPVAQAQDWSDGLDSRYVLSYGPFTLEPGDTMTLPFAYVAGEGFHTDPNNLLNLPNNPDAYYENLDFTDLIGNGIMAEWIYDNPGIDTDSDGYKGEYVLCSGDTVWVRGDGIPDRQAGTAPAEPQVEAIGLPGAIKVTWNGFASEHSYDPLARMIDFEGYRVYLGTDHRPSSLAQVAVYDLEDFIGYRYSTLVHDWEQLSGIHQLRDLRCRYSLWGCDDIAWHPLAFPRSDPFVWPADVDTVMYWEQYGPNTAEFGLETPIVKSYPDAPEPPYGQPEDVPPDSVEFYLTESGLFKYYQYELTIENLIPGQEYWVTVTAYDFGSQLPGAEAMESTKGNALSVTPLVASPQCCVGQTGNVNGSVSEKPTVADISALIDFLFMTGTLPACMTEADVDQSGGVVPGPTDITVGDIGALIDHLFISGTPLADCP